LSFDVNYAGAKVKASKVESWPANTSRETVAAQWLTRYQQALDYELWA